MKSLKNLLLLVALCFFQTVAKAISVMQSGESSIVLETTTGKIKGTILVPNSAGEMSVALIIAGSGPIDRDGNSPMMKNNSLKMLAEGLFTNNIASVRYDKRGIGESAEAGPNEIGLRFESYVNDVVDWIKLLKKDKRFHKVIVIGHSEGSLLGMVALQKVDGDAYISIAGVSQTADKILKIQLAQQSPEVKRLSYIIIDSLVAGKTVNKVDNALIGLFRPSVQPYLISLFKYDPILEVKKLTVPIYILHGTMDMQVSSNESMQLYNANKKAQYLPVKYMNHIFKDGRSDNSSMLASYKDASIPIMPDFVKAIADFILDL